MANHRIHREITCDNKEKFNSDISAIMKIKSCKIRMMYHNANCKQHTHQINRAISMFAAIQSTWIIYHAQPSFLNILNR